MSRVTSPEKVRSLRRAALDARLNLLHLCSLEAIHIGGDLSVADVMTVLWQHQIRYDPANPTWEGRDRFVLSKGHASAVTTINQAAIGCFPVEDVYREYATDGGRFSMHSCALINPFVDVSTGSLGHGLPIACGIASGLRLKNNTNSRVYVVMGDGEQGEGSIWEAAISAAHFGLGNLIAVLDWNGLEADGSVDDVAGLGDLAQRYRLCGWHVEELDGNDIAALIRAFDALPAADSNVPTLLACHTTKGKGVPFMENDLRWHAGKISQSQLHDARKALLSTYEGAVA